MPRLLALLLLVCLPLVARAAAPPSPAKSEEVVLYPVRQVLDIRYHDDARRQKLDVFAPKGAKGQRFPVVVFVHGGTWMFGDKNLFGVYRNVGRNLARHGIVTVMTNYRLSPWVKHPEHVKDVARAFAWTVHHIDRYCGDPDRIVLAGHSAGGHLAALLATDERYLKDPDLELTARQRKGLRGVVAMSGVYRVPPPDEFRLMSDRLLRCWVGDPTEKRTARLMTPLLRVVAKKVNPFNLVFGTDRDVQTQASPLSHVHKGLPPFLIMIAEYEMPRLGLMAEEFTAALRKCGNRVEYSEIEGCNHRTIVNQLHNGSEATRLVLGFVRQTAGSARVVK
jgi:acetyl esterase/lipase